MTQGAKHEPRSEGRAPTPRVVCGDIDIRIDRNGTWFYHGSPIGRKEMVCLFASVLQRYPDGSYWLVTPVEAGRIEVEDVPFVGVELFVSGTGRDQVVSVRTNVDQIITLDQNHPLRMMGGVQSDDRIPYVEVRDGLAARLLRPVFYELVNLAVPEHQDGDAVLGIWSKGVFFPLGAPDGAA